MIDIFMDNRESPNRKKIGKQFYGDSLHILTLETFDYIIGKDAKIGIESKTVKDLVASITDKSKRFENQSYKMAKFREEHKTHCYFFLQGSYKDIAEDPYYSWVTPKVWAGILASISEPKDMKIVPVDSDEMFWVQVERLIHHYDNKQPLKHVPIIPSGETVTTRMLQGITGLGEVRARAIADMFTIADLAFLQPEDLQKIDGIGPKYAETVIRAVKEGVG